MCGRFAGLLRARRALAPGAGVMLRQRAGYIQGKPPKDNIGPAVSSMSPVESYFYISPGS